MNKDILLEYRFALELLDAYDHQCIEEIDGVPSTGKLKYDECIELISEMNFSSSVFGKEKEEGKLKGILSSIEQTFINNEIYPSLEEKAANLLYFLIKDHPFVDGCKRIGAAIFLLYLKKNNAINRITNNTLVALVLLIAESRAEDKENIIKIVKSILCNYL